MLLRWWKRAIQRDFTVNRVSSSTQRAGSRTMSIAEARSHAIPGMKTRCFLPCQPHDTVLGLSQSLHFLRVCLCGGAPSFMLKKVLRRVGLALGIRTCSDAHQRRLAHPAKSTVLELAPVYCTSHQSNSFAASWYRAPCSAKQNLNFRSRLDLEALAASCSAAFLNHVLAFRLASPLTCSEARRLRRVAHRCRLSNSNRYTAIRISRKRNKTNTHSDC